MSDGYDSGDLALFGSLGVIVGFILCVLIVQGCEPSLVKRARVQATATAAASALATAEARK